MSVKHHGHGDLDSHAGVPGLHELAVPGVRLRRGRELVGLGGAVAVESATGFGGIALGSVSLLAAAGCYVDYESLPDPLRRAPKDESDPDYIHFSWRCGHETDEFGCGLGVTNAK